MRSFNMRQPQHFYESIKAAPQSRGHITCRDLCVFFTEARCTYGFDLHKGKSFADRVWPVFQHTHRPSQ
jgi:hypothetical protein